MIFLLLFVFRTLDDNSQGHGPMIGAVQLLTVLCQKRPKLERKMRKYSQHVLNRLGSLLRSSYDPDHDIGGVTDPFLQVHLLKLLRTISDGDKKISDEVDATLAQVCVLYIIILQLSNTYTFFHATREFACFFSQWENCGNLNQ